MALTPRERYERHKDYVAEWHRTHTAERKEHRRRWAERNPEAHRTYRQQGMRRHYSSRRARGMEQLRDFRRRDGLKEYVLQFYGSGTLACLTCGCADPDVLTIDHVNNDGAEHRKTMKSSGRDFYRWLKKNGMPSGFQTLCMNCNWKKHVLHARACAKERKMGQQKELF